MLQCVVITPIKNSIVALDMSVLKRMYEIPKYDCYKCSKYR